jgi:hypothetical protein
MEFVSNDTFWTTLIYYIGLKDAYHLKLCNKYLYQLISLKDITYYKVDKPLRAKYGQDWEKLKELLAQYNSFIGIPINSLENQENYMLVINSSYPDFSNYYFKAKTTFGEKIYYKRMDYDKEEANCGIFCLDFIDLKFIIFHKFINLRTKIIRKNKNIEYIYINSICFTYYRK